MFLQNQLRYFCISLISGYIFGIAYEIFYSLRLICGCVKGRRKGIETALDICFFIAFALWQVYISYLFYFPSQRVYLWIGSFLGLIIYLKSLHKIIAFLEKLWYNKIAQRVKNHKKSLKKRKKQEI